MFNNSSNLSDITECSVLSSEGATILSPVLMFLAGVLGNILALWSLYKMRTDGRTTKFYNFITGLVVTDLLGILMTSPSVIIAYINRRQWVGGDSHCRFHGFAMTCFGLATPLIICAMAVERFLALKCVFFYSHRCRPGTARACIFSLWLFVILYSLLPLLGFGKFELQYPGTWCYLDFHSDNILSNVYGYIYSCTNLALIIVIVVSNTYVVFTIIRTRSWREHGRLNSDSSHTRYHSSQEARGLVTSRCMKKKNGDAEVQMIVLLCALTIVFTICWAPLMFQILWTISTGRSNCLLDLAAVRLASINQTLDPWLYILLRRKSCLKLTHCFKTIKKVLCSDTRKDRESSQVHIQNNGNCKVILPAHNFEVKNCNLRHSELSSGENEDLPPLPDIGRGISNKDTRCICKFQFGTKNDSPDIEDGMYVKIFYMPNSSVTVRTNKINRFGKTYSPTERPCIFRALTSSDVRSDQATNCVNNKMSDNGTKETLTTSCGDKNTFHSDGAKVLNHKQTLHEGLRKTKSNTK